MLYYMDAFRKDTEFYTNRGDHTVTGGGLAFVFRDHLGVTVGAQPARFESFECQTITVNNIRPPLLIANIYRPPSSGMGTFSREFITFVS